MRKIISSIENNVIAGLAVLLIAWMASMIWISGVNSRDNVASLKQTCDRVAEIDARNKQKDIQWSSMEYKLEQIEDKLNFQTRMTRLIARELKVNVPADVLINGRD